MSPTDDPETPRPRILPFRVARQAWSWTWGGFDTLLRLGWAPALVVTALGALVEPAIVGFGQDAETLAASPAALLGLLLLAGATIVLMAIVLVGWQRALLLPGQDPRRRIHLRLAQRELTYGLIVFFLLGLVSMGLVTAPGALTSFATGQVLPGLFLLGGPVVALIVVSRSVMVLPAVALGRPAELGKAWQGARDNTVRIAATLFLVGLPAFVGQLLLMEMSAAVIGAELGLVVELVLRFVVALLSFVLAAPVAAATALLYVLLVERELQAILPHPASSFCESPR